MLDANVRFPPFAAVRHHLSEYQIADIRCACEGLMHPEVGNAY
ncbi:MAG: hypothetical protein AAFR71_14200 [Pseudomonadota bacterium]